MVVSQSVNGMETNTNSHRWSFIPSEIDYCIYPLMVVPASPLQATQRIVCDVVRFSMGEEPKVGLTAEQERCMNSFWLITYRLPRWVLYWIHQL